MPRLQSASINFIPALLPALLATTAFADGGDSAIRSALGRLAPDAKIERIAPAPMKDWSEVTLGSQIVYVSNDGKLVLNGSVIDVETRRDLTEKSRDGVRAQALSDVPKEALISFSPDQPKHRVTVFTAIDCGYCKALHAHVPALHAKGIAIDYVLIPRAAPGSPQERATHHVYCEDDAQNAFESALDGKGVTPDKACGSSGYQKALDLAQALGIQSTPTMVFSDGSLGLGLLSPEQVLERIEAARP